MPDQLAVLRQLVTTGLVASAVELARWVGLGGLFSEAKVRYVVEDAVYHALDRGCPARAVEPLDCPTASCDCSCPELSSDRSLGVVAGLHAVLCLIHLVLFWLHWRRDGAAARAEVRPTVRRGGRRGVGGGVVE